MTLDARVVQFLAGAPCVRRRWDRPVVCAALANDQRINERSTNENEKESTCLDGIGFQLSDYWSV